MIFEETTSYVLVACLQFGIYLVYGAITAAILVAVTSVDFQTAPIFFGTLIAATVSGFVLGVAGGRWLPDQIALLPYIVVPVAVESAVLAFINIE